MFAAKERKERTEKRLRCFFFAIFCVLLRPVHSHSWLRLCRAVFLCGKNLLELLHSLLLRFKGAARPRAKELNHGFVELGKDSATGASRFLAGSARCADLDAAARRPYLGIV